jgi:hypothetical protein
MTRQSSCKAQVGASAWESLRGGGEDSNGSQPKDEVRDYDTTSSSLRPEKSVFPF